MTWMERVAELPTAWDLIGTERLVRVFGGPAEIQRMHDDAEARLAEMEEEIERINEQLDVDVDEIELPEFKVPEPDVPPVHSTPFISSAMEYADATRRMISRKAYENGSGS